MDFLGNLITGLGVCMQPMNLLFCFLGVLIGTVVGVLPGIGPVGALSILLPVTYGVSPVAAVILLAGIYYGAMYGGSTTSILVNIPGEAASVVSCLEGYQMAKNGRAGAALGIAAFGSFIAGTLSVVALQAMSVPLVNVALRFGPPEYFSLMILGLVILTFLAQKSMIRALMMAGVGIFLGTIGIDTVTGTARFTFGSGDLFEGIGMAPLAMGLFGFSEIFLNVESKIKEELVIISTSLRELFPTLADWKRSIGAIFRGTIFGFFLGILPGGGGVLGSLTSYAVEKRVSKHPEEFGKGAIEGLAGPESANNSAATGSFIPLLTLGIPGNVTMGILMGAFMIHGIIPGPMLMTEHPDIFWGVVASMYVGNVMLIILNLPLIGIWVKLLRVPYSILFPLLVFICLCGAYLINSNTIDMSIMLGFGIFGYLMRKFKYEPAPLVLAFVLSKMLEKAFRQSLILSDGGFAIFFTRPISVGCLIVAGALLITSILPMVGKAMKRIKDEAEEV
jgi:putative tricarboxylic transport membrane protein